MPVIDPVIRMTKPRNSTVPCCFLFGNVGGFSEAIHNATRKHQSGGIFLEITENTEINIIQPDHLPNKGTSTIRKILRVNVTSNHALYSDIIYARPAKALHTYVRLMDVSSYLNKFLLNNAISDQLLKRLHYVKKILSQ